ncbi:MAG: 50S ribosomal protein L29 [Bacteroidota bacterium]
MKQQEITTLSVADLKSKIESFTEQLVRMKLNHKVAPIENPIQIRDIRRTVAKLNTELAKRETQA